MSVGKYKHIISKLEQFISKYYINELLKGGILFFAIGLFYFLITISFEYFFWLDKAGRLLLFWLFILVETLLFLRFVLYPFLKLIKLSRGIDYDQAARIIGNHFKEVDDKLLNILQLKKEAEQEESELLLAGIDQKAEELQPIPFQIAIDFKLNLKYLKYAILPVLILIFIWITDSNGLFTDSYARVVNYGKTYERPAPFSFKILNKELDMREKENFKLKIKIDGKIIPERVNIAYDGESYVLKDEGSGEFSYEFKNLKQNTTFSLAANGVVSKDYDLKVIHVPDLVDFKMDLNFPEYLNKTNETITGTGNVTVPEGTLINWIIDAHATDKIKLELPDTSKFFKTENNKFITEQIFTTNTAYSITTSNKAIKDFETLSYDVKIIKDEFPEIDVEMKRDTVNRESLYFRGKVSDDHGLSQLVMVYYPRAHPDQKSRVSLPVSKANVDEFMSVFPDTLELHKGERYELYFEVFDNDGVNGAKSSRSALFDYQSLTDNERDRKNLENQRESLDGLGESLDHMKTDDQDLEEINRLSKEKETLNYNDRKKLADFLEKEKNRNEMMKDFSDKMKKNLEEELDNTKTDFEKEALKERMERNEERLEENEKLMKELEKYRDKIDRSDMSQKLEEIAKNKNTQQRSLEELIELTKRYYIRNKAENLSKEIEEMGIDQDSLAYNNQQNSSEDQEKLNNQFQDIKKELNDLKKENKALPRPLKLGLDDALTEEIDGDQKKAKELLEELEDKTDAIEQNEQNKDEDNNQLKKELKKKQESAAEKLDEMSKKMKEKRQEGDKEQMEEDAQTLRQILDNLVIFSFEQEDLLLDFKALEAESPEFGEKLKKQQSLREHFKHVDDSLYSLALRNPMISDEITDKLSAIDFNITKSLERLSKNNFNTGVANQHYVLTGANDLANILDDVLGAMENKLESQGSDSGLPENNPDKDDEFQLDDIIKNQENLNDQSSDGEDSDGEDKDGEKGKDGKEGEQSEQGQDGASDGNEELSEELYEIFKRQQELRLNLEEIIEKRGLEKEGKELLDEMEHVEQNLLEDGFTDKTRAMMQRIKDNMLELKDASYEQEKDNERQAETNLKDYKSDAKEALEEAKEYFNRKEILNRETLPLRTDYKRIVQDYFSKEHD